MALYLVVHSPRGNEEDPLEPPARMIDLARQAGADGVHPRWLKTYSPDLHDDRIFTLWDAESSDDIVASMSDYGFLTHLDAKPFRVQEWGPADVLAIESLSEGAS